MSMRILIACFLSLLACGCGSASRSQSGDVGAFIVQEVARHGGHTRGTNTVSHLQAHWNVKSDHAGFQAHFTGVQFSEVQSVLQQAFGPPTFVTTNMQGRLHGLYQAQDIGVALQFFGESAGVRIICVRGIKL